MDFSLCLEKKKTTFLSLSLSHVYVAFCLCQWTFVRSNLRLTRREAFFVSLTSCAVLACCSCCCPCCCCYGCCGLDCSFFWCAVFQFVSATASHNDVVRPCAAVCLFGSCWFQREQRGLAVLWCLVWCSRVWTRLVGILARSGGAALTFVSFLVFVEWFGWCSASLTVR